MKLDIPGLCDLDLNYIHALAEKSARKFIFSDRLAESRFKSIVGSDLHQSYSRRLIKIATSMSLLKSHLFGVGGYFYAPSGLRLSHERPLTFSPSIREVLLNMANLRSIFRTTKDSDEKYLAFLSFYDDFDFLISLCYDILVEKEGF